MCLCIYIYYIYIYNICICRYVCIDVYVYGGGGCLVVKSCPTLWDPMDCRISGSSVHGISQVRILEWGTIFCSRRSL